MVAGESLIAEAAAAEWSHFEEDRLSTHWMRHFVIATVHQDCPNSGSWLLSDVASGKDRH